ncbi:MAG: accessory secretory system protein Asp4 [Cardiobacteriaceae bacterium]|nr:accessory secretory system protein Asp4 [Cardiobacteriaceae bacterium]
MAKDDKDIFYQDIEGKLDNLKRKPPEKEKLSRADKINNVFSVSLGIVILVGLLFTLFSLLR